MRLVVILAAVFMSGVAIADDRPLDVTIRVVKSPNDLPAAVTNTIELPPSAAAVARERAAGGLDKANQARELGREFGQSAAEAGKSHGQGHSGGGRP